MSNHTFYVIGLPDTQNYSELYPEIFKSQTEWIINNQSKLDIQFVSHYGDLVQNGTGPSALQEYENAEAAMRLLLDANIPHGIVAGNHDVLESGSAESTYEVDNYLQYFGPRWYAERDWFGGSSPSGLSTYQLFEGNGTKFLALHLHLETPHTELAWAQGIINENRDKPVMVTTHRYLQDAEDYTAGIPIVPSGRYPEIWYLFEGQYNPDGIRAEELWNHFIATNRNIFLVNSGHFGEEYRQISNNIHNLAVHEVLADYEEEPNGGNGYLRMMEFDTIGDRINVSSYSPTLNDFRTEDESQFSLEVDFEQYVAPNPTVYFQNGVNDYQGTQDTWINEAAKGSSYGNGSELAIDDDTINSWWRDRQGQTLLKFDDIIGDEVDRIPLGAKIERANLKLTLSNDIDSLLHRPDLEIYYMTRDWDESSTWNSLGNGLTMGNDFDELINTFAGNDDPNEYNIRHVDIREAVQRWANGEMNYGLGIVSESIKGNDDGIELFASEAGQIMYRPVLEVEYTFI